MRRRGGSIAAALALALVAGACQSARTNARCRGTDFGRDGGMIVRCISGRWRPLMTVADYLAFLARLKASAPAPQPTPTTVTPTWAPPTTPPPTTPPPTTPPPTTPPPPPPPPPEVTSILAVNVVWSDAASTPVDSAGIAHEAELAVGWFRAQAGKVPRFVRAGTAIEVRTAKVSVTRAVFEAMSFSSQVGAIRAAAAASPDQYIAAFVDSDDATACGRSGGDLIMYTDTGSTSCPARPTIATTAFPFGNTYLIAHELTHSLGAVPACAPHADGSGHLNDDPRDVLYSGPLARDWGNLTLDPGHDDYFRTGRTDCTDIDRSPLWAPA